MNEDTYKKAKELKGKIANTEADLKMLTSDRYKPYVSVGLSHNTASGQIVISQMPDIQKKIRQLLIDESNNYLTKLILEFEGL